MAAPAARTSSSPGAGHACGSRALASGRRVVAADGAAHSRRGRGRPPVAVQGPRRRVRRVAPVPRRRRSAHDRLARHGADRQAAHESLPRRAQSAGVRVARPAPADVVRDARRLQRRARGRDGGARRVERSRERRSARRPRVLGNRAPRAAAGARLARGAASAADDLHANPCGSRRARPRKRSRPTPSARCSGSRASRVPAA